MNLGELLEQNKRALKQQEALPIKDQINLLKKHKKSVFTFHLEDGRKLVRGDSESDKETMKKFFKKYPQNGCKSIEFHK